MGKLEKIRAQFIGKRGGKFIHFEAVLLGILLAVYLHYSGFSTLLMLVIPAAVIFVFPILTGVFQPLALLAAFLFSLMWGFLAFVFGGAIFNRSMLVGSLCGIAGFLLSFRLHKNYSGIQFYDISRKPGAAPAPPGGPLPRSGQRIVFCPKCGRRITSADGSCEICGRT